MTGNFVVTPPTHFKESVLPTGLYNQSLFLGGSIEMGKAENWQDKIIKDLKNNRLLILNPRRDDWDSSWKQDITNPNFYEQVNWELSGLDFVDVIAFYFDPNTKSPVTMLELGLYATSSKIVVYCPEPFWRKGNIDIVGQRYGFPVHTNYETFLLNIKTKLGIL